MGGGPDGKKEGDEEGCKEGREAHDEEEALAQEVARTSPGGLPTSARPPANPAVGSPAVPPPINDGDRKLLLLELRALTGASLQKLWLPSPRLCVLQFRLPGRTVLALIDAASRFAAVTPERPTAPDSAPRSQATLRNALEGARLSGAALVLPRDRRVASPRLEFGDRFLIAEEALLLVEAASGRILWASSGARRRGTLARRAAVASGLAPAARRSRGARSGLVPHRQRGAPGGSRDPARSRFERHRECRTLAPPRQAVSGGGRAHHRAQRRSTGGLVARRSASRAGRGGARRGAARGRGAGSAPDATGRKAARADPPALSEIHVANGRADPDRPQRARQRCAHAARRARQRPLAARPRRPGSARDRARRRRVAGRADPRGRRVARPALLLRAR